MTRYKIGEVARLLGLPNDTLRYYERRGIVSPHRDDESGYRYYSAWDLNTLLDSKWYRSFDFSLSDVEQMLYTDELDEFMLRCHRHEMELINTINSYQQKLKSLVLFYQRIERARVNAGMLEVVDSPPIIYQKHRRADDFVSGDDALASIQKWTDLMPFVDHTFLITGTGYGENRIYDNYYWGFSLPPKAALRYGIEILPPVEHFPSQKCVHTYFTAGGRGTFLCSFNEQIGSKLKEHGYNVTGSPFGHLIVRAKKDGEFTRLMEVWIPIE